MTRKTCLLAVAFAILAAAAPFGCGGTSGTAGGGGGGAGGWAGSAAGAAGVTGTAGTTGAAGAPGMAGATEGAGTTGTAGVAGTAGAASGLGGSAGGAAGGSGGTTITGSARAGAWTGRYEPSELYGLSFIVDATGNIADFTISGSVPAPCGSNTVFEVTATGPVVVAADGSYSFTASGCLGSECATYNIAGNFTTDALSTGTRTVSGFTNLTTACFGTSSGSAPWTASKDCMHAPTKGGASKTRFCGDGGAGEGAGGAAGAGGGTGAAGAGGGTGAAGAGGANANAALGKPCIISSCSSAASVCDETVAADCGGGTCVGSPGGGFFCSVSCSVDQDCVTSDGPAMNCLTSCKIPFALGCWPSSAYPMVTSLCK